MVRLLPLSALLVVTGSLWGQIGQSSCRPQVDNRRVGSAIELPPGRYDLTLVAIAGSAAGAEAKGVLHLRRLPEIHDGGATWGAVELDFAAVGAPFAGDSTVPSPNSTDPAWPGVVVYRQQPADTNQVANVRLLIGTRQGGLDGTGIALQVRHTSPVGFSGTWGEFGIARDGSGYFCATRRD